MLTLTKISETATKITLGWTPVAGCVGYRFQSSSQAPKWSHTWDATRSQVTFAKADSYKVEALGVTEAGVYPSAPPPQFQTQAIDGGLGYYGQFANPLPTTSDYFPLGIWGSYNHTQFNRDLDAAAGINLYAWAADAQWFDEFRADGRFRVTALSSQQGVVESESAAWGPLGDEIDQSGNSGSGDANLRHQAAVNAINTLNGVKAGLPNDGRMLYNNYAKGVLFWHSDADAAAFINFQAFCSVDTYWFTDPDSHIQSQGGKAFAGGTRALTPAENRRASNYGWNIERTRSLANYSKPIYSFVEVGSPFTNGIAITGPQVRAAVWHSIIAGARGIIYFVHSFGGSCTGDYNVLRTNCNGTRPTVVALNAQIKSLAPVLNSPTLISGLTATASVKAMGKWDGQNVHVFAGAKENASSTATFSVPSAGNTTATVIGENRTIPVVNGSWQDSFADGNAVHIYRL